MKSRRDGMRWTVWQRLSIADGVMAAVILVEGVWLDMLKKSNSAVRLKEQFLHMPSIAEEVEMD